MIRDYDSGDTLADLDRDEAAAHDRYERAARRNWCSVCHTMGGHAPGCPDAEDEIDDGGDE